ncbi:hypothetical protein LK09_13680 [Microbacterium mangrovi]|uniref:Uncharacterized protein n=1 Tax=Microbacterium mangrovi TaxID=1348253 RepID=A0A0B2A5Q8_9MICO|nr:hypothetical protein [Microbacterium mangrovi]KHK96893.1 hypothetical protein LK09_13680 [Microbacterium mangrovi]
MPATQRSAAIEGTRPPVAADPRARVRGRARWARVAAAGLAASALVVGATAAATAETRAAWTDATRVSASVTSGAWSALGSCTALNSAGAAVGTCAITSIVYDATGALNKHVRSYYATFSVSSSAASAVVFQANLGAATVRTDTSVGAWTWTSAFTIAGLQMTPTSPCAALPSLSGRATSANWATLPTVPFQIADARSAVQGSPSCS